jgi:hypothetical protein
MFILLAGTAIALGGLAIAPGRDFARYGYYYGDTSFGYDGGPSFGRSPMYAPDQPSQRRYNNSGRPDFQDA